MEAENYSKGILNALTESQIERYSRQLLLTGWGSAEQVRLARAAIGVSAKAEIALRYLVGAGIGSVAVLGDEMPQDVIEDVQLLNPEVEISRLEWRSQPTLDAAIVFEEDLEGELASVLSRTATLVLVCKERVMIDSVARQLPLFLRGNTIYAQAFSAALVLEKLSGSK